MSVYVSKRSESKALFLENARKLSAHTLTYCLKAPKRLTFKRISTTYQIYEKLKNKKFKFSKPYIFHISEREKTRKIQAQKLSERILQRTLCDHVI